MRRGKEEMGMWYCKEFTNFSVFNAKVCTWALSTEFMNSLNNTIKYFPKDYSNFFRV